MESRRAVTRTAWIVFAARRRGVGELLRLICRLAASDGSLERDGRNGCEISRPGHRNTAQKLDSKSVADHSKPGSGRRGEIWRRIRFVADVARQAFAVLCAGR